jgi:hypothetical protein
VADHVDGPPVAADVLVAVEEPVVVAVVVARVGPRRRVGVAAEVGEVGAAIRDADLADPAG